MNDTNTIQNRRTAGAHSGERASLTELERAIGLIAVALVLGSAMLSGGGRASEVETHSVTIARGQTLWTLAQEYPVPGLDTADTADLIADINGLEGGKIVAGASLKVPHTPATSAVAMR